MKIVDGVLMVHGSQARTVTSPGDIERLRAQGWLVANPKPKTKMAKRMRELRQQRAEAGWLSLKLWLTPEHAALVRAARRPGEDYAGLLVRLVQEQQGLHVNELESSTDN